MRLIPRDSDGLSLAPAASLSERQTADVVCDKHYVPTITPTYLSHQSVELVDLGWNQGSKASVPCIVGAVSPLRYQNFEDAVRNMSSFAERAIINVGVDEVLVVVVGEIGHRASSSASRHMLQRLEP
jgi:hypothetical protein